MAPLEIALDVILMLVCVVAAYTDLTRHVIHDWLTLPTLAVGLVVHFIVGGLGGMFDAGLTSALFGAGFCFLVFGLFLIWGKGMGAGDVKLITAVGAVTGFHSALTCAMATVIVGAVLAVVLLVLRVHLLGGEGGRLRAMFVTRVKGENRVTLPYALPIALGVVWGLLVKYGWLTML